MASRFRSDINGLRAVAVIAVVAFHFKVDFFKGGFIGVDIFFVISGYLMTRIIFSKLEKDRFSIVEFYLARARRVMPALLVVSSLVLILGWFYISPTDYKILGKHVTSSVLFLSNFTYWSEAGYFDSSSHEKWLLHTWSLSLEWQFYMGYPILIVLITRYFKNHYKKILLGLMLFSYALSVLLSYECKRSF